MGFLRLLFISKTGAKSTFNPKAFRKNTNQLLALINSIKETNLSNHTLPLFLGIDEEGGRIEAFECS